MNPTNFRRIRFLGCPLDRMTRRELLAEVAEAIRFRKTPRVIQFVNANKVAMLRRDPSLRPIMERADYVLTDGQPMLPMAAMLGHRIPERIDGIGLMQSLLELAEAEGFSVYLLGARQPVLEACVEEIRRRHPRLDIRGFRNGYFTDDEAPAVVGEVRRLRPDILFLGMGSPQKERLADRWKHLFGATVIQGVGGSFDVLAGMVKRAPLWVQRAGLEWLFRVAQEPRRMFWRYTVTNGLCLWLFLKALGARLAGGTQPHTSRPGTAQ